MSAASLLLSLAALAIFGYSFYFMSTDPKVRSMHKLMAPELGKYGHLKYLTFQCLCIQLVNALLHVLAHLSSAFEKPRDFLFNSLAYPVGSVVCYTFWAVWFVVGRELIFPTALDAYYPFWLNQATHTIIAPINILLALLVNHKFSSRQMLTCLGYHAAYTLFLFYIKWDTGVFVYPFLEAFSELQRTLYFLSTGVLAFVMLKSGQFLGQLAHGQASQRPALKKQKQK